MDAKGEAFTIPIVPKPPYGGLDAWWSYLTLQEIISLSRCSKVLYQLITHPKRNENEVDDAIGESEKFMLRVFNESLYYSLNVMKVLDKKSYYYSKLSQYSYKWWWPSQMNLYSFYDENIFFKTNINDMKHKQLFQHMMFPNIAMECETWLLRVQYCDKHDVLPSKSNNNPYYSKLSAFPKYQSKSMVNDLINQVDSTVSKYHSEKRYQQQGSNIMRIMRFYFFVTKLINNLQNPSQHCYAVSRLYDMFSYFNVVRYLEHKKRKEVEYHQHIQLPDDNFLYRHLATEVIFKLMICEFGSKINARIKFEKKKFWYWLIRENCMSLRRVGCSLYDFRIYNRHHLIEYCKQQQLDFLDLRSEHPDFWYQNFEKSYDCIDSQAVLRQCCIDRVNYNYDNTIGIYRHGILLSMYIFSNGNFSKHETDKELNRDSIHHSIARNDKYYQRYDTNLYSFCENRRFVDAMFLANWELSLKYFHFCGSTHTDLIKILQFCKRRLFDNLSGKYQLQQYETIKQSTKWIHKCRMLMKKNLANTSQ